MESVSNIRLKETVLVCYEKKGISRKEYSEFREYVAEKGLYQKCLIILEAIDND